jgi:hypothetical protein
MQPFEKTTSPAGMKQYCRQDEYHSMMPSWKPLDLFMTANTFVFGFCAISLMQKYLYSRLIFSAAAFGSIGRPQNSQMMFSVFSVIVACPHEHE